MLDHPDHTRLVPRPTPELPVSALVRDKPVEEVADLLPRLFNLCRAAQRAAVRAVLGLPVTAKDLQAVRAEIQREHLIKLGIILPGKFGLPSQSAVTRFPDTPGAFDLFLNSDDPLATLLRHIARMFGPGQAVAMGLDIPKGAIGFDIAPLENSVAGRVADDPVMQHIEAGYGRGPLWRTAARAVELRRIADGWQPWITRTHAGVLAPAARGTYALAATLHENRVETFHRVTPTDHLLATNGILQASLDTLTDRRSVDHLLAILDPCSPVELTEVTGHA